MSLAINRLEKGKMVRRRKSKIDARKVEIVLTTNGERIKQSNTVLDASKVKAMLKQMTPKDRRSALDGLAILSRAADAEMKRKSLDNTWSKR